MSCFFKATFWCASKIVSLTLTLETVEKLITSGVGLYQNKVEHFFKKILESELFENVQG